MSDGAIYIEKGDRKLRCGFTTGSCAAAAAKAALIMLLEGGDVHQVSIETPKGPVFDAEITEITREGNSVSCAVVKDGGDDPDVTSGALVYARVTLTDSEGVSIKGGKGIGIVTKPGLDREVGDYAINTVPRQMITEGILEVFFRYGIKDRGAEVVISIPSGCELAEKTFNPRLGIVGGISVLGTTGIVEPMSDRAIIDTIRAEISMRKALGREMLLVAPGNYGLEFLQKRYRISAGEVVLCSNFVCEAVLLACELGFERLLLVGHIGKLIKVAGGIKNTHSMYGDHRMEILCDIASEFIPLKEQEELIKKISECVMTDAAIQILKEKMIAHQVFEEMTVRIKKYLEDWSGGRIEAETIVFSNENGELAASDRAPEFLEMTRSGEGV